MSRLKIKRDDIRNNVERFATSVDSPMGSDDVIVIYPGL